jgi:hypothetical protein
MLWMAFQVIALLFFRLIFFSGFYTSPIAGLAVSYPLFHKSHPLSIKDHTTLGAQTGADEGFIITPLALC